MAAAIALNDNSFFSGSASRPESSEQKALDFFRRADMSASLVNNGGGNYSRESASRPENAEQQALDFFRRAELSDTKAKSNGANLALESARRSDSLEQTALGFFQRAELSDALARIWECIKRQRVGTMLRIIKAVAIIAAVILFSQSISFTGLLALAGSIIGLLFTAITSAFIWFIYIPLYFIATPNFASSILLAIGLAWLGGVSPFIALVFSPLVLFGFRLLDSAEMAQSRIAEIPNAIGKTLEKANLGAVFQQAAGNVASFVGVIPRRVAKAALLPEICPVPIKA